MDEESASCSKDQPFGRKRDISEDLVKQSQKKCQESNGKKMESSSQGIRQFKVSNDKIPFTFRLLRVQGR